MIISRFTPAHSFYKSLNAIVICLLLTRFGGVIDLGPLFFNLAFFLYLLFFCTLMAFRKSFLSKKSVGMFAILFGFYCYGVLKPVWDGNSTFYYSIWESRHFITWLMFPVWLYFLAPPKGSGELDLSWIWVFTGCACYLSFVIIIFYLFGIRPPGYSVNTAGVLHVAVPTLLLVALFLIWAKSLSVNSGFSVASLLTSSLIIVAIVLEGHRSLLLGLLCAVVIFLYGKYRNKFSLWLGRLILLFPFIFLLIVAPYVQNLLVNDAAFQSRFNINAIRFDYLQEQLYWGYGFIDENSSLGLEASLTARSRFQETFGTVDFGYLDIALKFGLVGGVFFLLFFVWLGLKAFLSRDLLFQLASSFMLGLFIINLTWSMFTYAHGILLAALLSAMIITRYKVCLRFKRVYKNFSVGRIRVFRWDKSKLFMSTV